MSAESAGPGCAIVDVLDRQSLNRQSPNRQSSIFNQSSMIRSSIFNAPPYYAYIPLSLVTDATRPIATT